jgi:hypothetical protein
MRVHELERDHTHDRVRELEILEFRVQIHDDAQISDQKNHPDSVHRRFHHHCPLFPRNYRLRWSWILWSMVKGGQRTRRRPGPWYSPSDSEKRRPMVCDFERLLENVQGKVGTVGKSIWQCLADPMLLYKRIMRKPKK